MRYRTDNQPHIDGLRAIAVIGVMLFHLDLQQVSGGFAGVDVFFVISGYLITKLLVSEMEQTGTLKLTGFYFRRICRLLPALVVMLFAVLLIASLTFSPTALEQMAHSLVYASLGLSNFVFWLEAGYFDVESNLKPLLHTWSLGVEEQFYLVWPALILLIFKVSNRRFLAYAISLIGLSSLLLNHAVGTGWLNFPFDQQEVNATPQATLFYLVPFRAFEFVIGALLVWVPALATHNWVSKLGYWLGMLATVGSFAMFDSDMLFPSYPALLPCLGTALLIYTGSINSRFNILQARWVVSIGLISYSLYLYHWPVIVFWNYLSVGDRSLFDTIAVIFLSFLFGWLSYKYVEQPFRNPLAWQGNVARKPILAMGIMGLVVAGQHISISNGWTWRIATTDLTQFEYGGNGYPYDDRVDPTRQDSSIYLVGDSHARHYADGLFSEYVQPQGKSMFVSAGLSCLHLPGFTRNTPGSWDKWCPRAVSRVIERIKNEPSPPTVFMSHSWHNQLHRAALLDEDGKKAQLVTIDDIIHGLAAFKTEIGAAELVVIGQLPSTGVYLADWLTRPALVLNKDVVKSTVLEKKIRTLNNKLRDASQTTSSFTFIDPTTFLCDQNVCQILDDDGIPLYSDVSHLSKRGSRVVMRRVIQAWSQPN